MNYIKFQNHILETIYLHKEYFLSATVKKDYKMENNEKRYFYYLEIITTKKDNYFSELFNTHNEAELYCEEILKRITI